MFRKRLRGKTLDLKKMGVINNKKKPNEDLETGSSAKKKQRSPKKKPAPVKKVKKVEKKKKREKKDSKSKTPSRIKAAKLETISVASSVRGRKAKAEAANSIKQIYTRKSSSFTPIMPK